MFPFFERNLTIILSSSSATNFMCVVFSMLFQDWYGNKCVMWWRWDFVLSYKQNWKRNFCSYSVFHIWWELVRSTCSHVFSTFFSGFLFSLSFTRSQNRIKVTCLLCGVWWVVCVQQNLLHYTHPPTNLIALFFFLCVMTWCEWKENNSLVHSKVFASFSGPVDWTCFLNLLCTQK